MFKMTYNKEQLSGAKPVVPGIYTVRFETFKPKWANDKSGNPGSATNPTSKNLNGWCYITGHPDYEEGKQLVVANLNEGIPSFIQDFCHSFGVPFEIDPATGDPSFPGIMDADPNIFNEGDPTTWRYAGPLTNKTAQWELGVKEYKGRNIQEIRRFICAVPNCAETYPDIRHATDMAKKG